MTQTHNGMEQEPSRLRRVKAQIVQKKGGVGTTLFRDKKERLPRKEGALI